MSRSVRALLALVLLVLVARPAVADTWYESYHKAEEALAKERWGDAVRHLNAALEARPDSSAQERTYGLRFVDYFNETMARAFKWTYTGKALKA